MMGIIGGLVFSVACWTLPRLSHLGKAYLERLKLAYGGLRSRLDADENWTVHGLEVAGREGQDASGRGLLRLPAAGGGLRDLLAGRHAPVRPEHDVHQERVERRWVWWRRRLWGRRWLRRRWWRGWLRRLRGG